MSESGETVRLGALLDALAEGLREAQERQRARTAGGEPAILNLDSCTITLGVDWTVKGHGELDVFVVKLGAGADRMSTQTIAVTMTPTDWFKDRGGVRIEEG